MKHEKKTCVECGKHSYIYAKGMCKFCSTKVYLKRRAEKKNRLLKDTPAEYVDASSEFSLFLKIWNSNYFKKSFLSGRYLSDFKIGMQQWYSLFAHVLSKAENRYPKFRLYRKNIVLLHPEEHFLFDQGNSDQRAKYEKEYNCSFDKLERLKEELIIEYENIK